MSLLPRALSSGRTKTAAFLRHLVAREDFVVVKNSSGNKNALLLSTFACLGEIDFCAQQQRRRRRRNATAATTSVPVSSYSREEKQRRHEGGGGVLLSVSLTNRIHASATASRLNEEDSATLESNFSQKANEYLETLGEKLESWADEEIEKDVECDYSDGVLTISLGRGRGTYVLNKQAPNRQIWWSSPISGPHRFEEEGERWVDARRGEKDCLDDLETKLKSEWRELFKGKKELCL